MGVIGWMVAGQHAATVAADHGPGAHRHPQAISRTASRFPVPDDELKQLADTFDDMLARLEQSFVAQRRFSAQVSHELRSPLALVRNEVELLLPDVDDETVASSLRSIRDAGLRAERLVTALLVLARSEGGHLDMKSVSLDEVVGVAVGELVESDDFRRLRVDVELHSVDVVGDESLLESLVRNLVDNAALHNTADGWVRVRVGYSERRRRTPGHARDRELDAARSGVGYRQPGRSHCRAVGRRRASRFGRVELAATRRLPREGRAPPRREPGGGP